MSLGGLFEGFMLLYLLYHFFQRSLKPSPYTITQGERRLCHTERESVSLPRFRKSFQWRHKTGRSFSVGTKSFHIPSSKCLRHIPPSVNMVPELIAKRLPRRHLARTDTPPELNRKRNNQPQFVITFQNCLEIRVPTIFSQ